MPKRKLIEQVVGSLAVFGALLDEKGAVVALSSRLMAGSAERTKPQWPKLGASYLDTHGMADPQLLHVHRGLRDLIDRRIDFFSTLLWLESSSEPTWYLMAAFPKAPTDSRTVLLFIDLSSAIGFSSNFSASMIGRGAAASSQVEAIITSTVRHAISETLARSMTAAPSETMSKSDLTRLDRLTKTERELLDLLAVGLTNTEIARKRQVTINTVKTQVAGLIRKLGLPNRTQAALFAAKNSHRKK